MKGSVLKMSRHKFASNVVEKVLVNANPETRFKLVDEILTIEHGVDPVHALMMDAYGSKLYLRFLFVAAISFDLDYVIQTALNQVDSEQRELLYARVRSHLISIKHEPRPKIEPKHIIASRFLYYH